jgi:hypothetical protein
MGDLKTEILQILNKAKNSGIVMFRSESKYYLDFTM